MPGVSVEYTAAPTGQVHRTAIRKTWLVHPMYVHNKMFFYGLNRREGSHLFLTTDLPAYVSVRIKRQVLDQSRVLSADSGHHSLPDCTALEYVHSPAHSTDL